MFTAGTVAVTALLIIAAVFFIGTIVLDILAIRRWKGLWKVAAGIPLAALASIIIIIVSGIIRDPQSHNLWPFEILMWSLGGLLFLGITCLFHRLMKVKHEQPSL